MTALLMRPKLVDELVATDGHLDGRRSKGPGAGDAGLERLRVSPMAMLLAVEGPFGRSFAGAARVPGVPTAGKSGTAQLGGGAAPHSWFIGVARGGPAPDRDRDRRRAWWLRPSEPSDGRRPDEPTT